MIKIKLKELLEKKKMSRYRMNKITGWNDKRLKALSNSDVKQITIEELEKMCEIFECDIPDILEVKK